MVAAADGGFPFSDSLVEALRRLLEFGGGRPRVLGAHPDLQCPRCPRAMVAGVAVYDDGTPFVFAGCTCGYSAWQSLPARRH